jgi:molecular chaperone DnaJ
MGRGTARAGHSHAPAIDGKVTVKIPPGTQPDEALRLKGKGLPEFGGGPRGDLYLRVRVRVPERPSTEERELYERLRALGKTARREE